MQSYGVDMKITIEKDTISRLRDLVFMAEELITHSELYEAKRRLEEAHWLLYAIQNDRKFSYNPNDTPYPEPTTFDNREQTSPAKCPYCIPNELINQLQVDGLREIHKTAWPSCGDEVSMRLHRLEGDLIKVRQNQVEIIKKLNEITTTIVDQIRK
jgi:hypothetical protein